MKSFLKENSYFHSLFTWFLWIKTLIQIFINDVTHSKIKQKCFFRNSITSLNQGDDTWVLKFPCVQKINIRSAKAKCDIAHHSRRKIKIELLLPIWKIYHHQCDCRCRAVGAGGRGGHCTPHILADQLTLSQPGGQMLPTTLLLAPLDLETYLHLCALMLYKQLRKLK